MLTRACARNSPHIIVRMADIIIAKEGMKHKNPFIDESAFEGEDTPKKSEDEVLMEEAKQNTEVKVVKT